MAKHETGIQWTHVPGYIGATWNPTTGCTRVSPGCDHCYAFALHDQRYKVNLDAAKADEPTVLRTPHDIAAARQRGIALPMPPQYDVPFSQVQVLDDKRLTEPLHRTAPRAYFVDSMSDLFHEAVSDEAIDRVFAVMALSPQHLFMILTKRPERMRAYIVDRAKRSEHGVAFPVWWASVGLLPPTGRDSADMAWPLPNVWLGTSVEDQARADERIPLLLDTPAAVRFLSMEPLLGPVDLTAIDKTHHSDPGFSALTSSPDESGTLGAETIDWVIVGGESGKGARPFDVAWARSLRDQCKAAGVPFFMKQVGARPHDRNDQGFEGEDESEWPEDTRTVDQTFTPIQGDPVLVRLRHSHGANPDEWPEDLRVRQFPGVAVAS
jgi:protein gp37